mgnify:CR=1 FL=1
MGRRKRRRKKKEDWDWEKSREREKEGKNFNLLIKKIEHESYTFYTIQCCRRSPTTLTQWVRACKFLFLFSSIACKRASNKSAADIFPHIEFTKCILILDTPWSHFQHVIQPLCSRWRSVETFVKIINFRWTKKGNVCIVLFWSENYVSQEVCGGDIALLSYVQIYNMNLPLKSRFLFR